MKFPKSKIDGIKIQILSTTEKTSKNEFLYQEINSWDKRGIPVTRNQFLSQEIDSCHKQLILVTRNQLFSQLPNQPATLHESYQKFCLSLKIS